MQLPGCSFLLLTATLTATGLEIGSARVSSGRRSQRRLGGITVVDDLFSKFLPKIECANAENAKPRSDEAQNGGSDYLGRASRSCVAAMKHWLPARDSRINAGRGLAR
jgi:hypothetical protein